MDDLTRAILGIIFGLSMLIAGGELMVRGASRLAAAMHISPLVIGLTVVAFGTSSPELAVSLQSVLTGSGDIALGNVVGSNILNVLLILGSSALIVPLVVSSRLIRWDVPLMIVASILVFVLGRDGRIGRLDGFVLFGILIVYLSWCIWESRRESKRIHAESSGDVSRQPASRGKTVAVQIAVQICFIVGGLILLGVGANWLIAGSVKVATQLGVSKLIIGLTIVALGTSLPEVVTSVMAAWRGERDIAVGNVVGSNLFNILCVLGLSSAVSGSGIEVSSTALRFDIPVMIAVAVACLPIFFTGNVIARWEGGLFFAYYLAYTTYLVLDALESEFSRTMSGVMVVFVIPLTLITILITTFRTIREKA